MDTRFWGPDGWKLLHSIASNYPSHPTTIEKKTFKNFFYSVQYVLPCVYCRMSLQEYFKILPIDDYLNNNYDLSFWLYKIHNKVNGKLRKQGLNHEKNPSFQSIFQYYRNLVKDTNKANCIEMPGWNFLYTIVFNYPEFKNDIEEIRYVNYMIFFKILPFVIPFKINICPHICDTNFMKIMNSRNSFKKWFFVLEKTVKSKFNQKCLKYNERCKFIEQYRAGCGSKKDKKKTCRIKKKI